MVFAGGKCTVGKTEPSLDPFVIDNFNVHRNIVRFFGGKGGSNHAQTSVMSAGL